MTMQGRAAPHALLPARHARCHELQCMLVLVRRCPAGALELAVVFVDDHQVRELHDALLHPLANAWRMHGECMADKWRAMKGNAITRCPSSRPADRRAADDERQRNHGNNITHKTNASARVNRWRQLIELMRGGP